MDDYGHVMLACPLVILEIICVYHISSPQFTGSSCFQDFRSSYIGSPNMHWEF